jgi:hypothetical protein
VEGLFSLFLATWIVISAQTLVVLEHLKKIEEKLDEAEKLLRDIEGHMREKAGEEK